MMQYSGLISYSMLIFNNLLQVCPEVSAEHFTKQGIQSPYFKRLRSLENDSEESILPVYVARRAGKKNRIVIPASQAGNRFLDS